MNKKCTSGGELGINLFFTGILGGILIPLLKIAGISGALISMGVAIGSFNLVCAIRIKMGDKKRLKKVINNDPSNITSAGIKTELKNDGSQSLILDQINKSSVPENNNPTNKSVEYFTIDKDIENKKKVEDGSQGELTAPVLLVILIVLFIFFFFT